ncbi:MAG: hypothetical protein HFF54_09370 [Lawsonibacter sp.]|nr:hypothetical protein [Lawsonibacter sp.]
MKVIVGDNRKACHQSKGQTEGLPLDTDGPLHLILIFILPAAFFQNFVLFQVEDLFSNDFGAGPAVTSSVEGIIARRGYIVKYTCQKNNETWQMRIGLPFPEKQGTIRSNIA